MFMNIPSMAQLLAFAHHHPILFGAFGFVLLLFIANELYSQLSGGPRVNTGQAVRLINDRDAVALDVRQPAEFKKGHLLGAINIPAAKIKERASELEKHKQRPVIVYSNTGGGSLEPAKILRSHGFPEVYALRGGINGWMTDNLPVTVK